MTAGMLITRSGWASLWSGIFIALGSCATQNLPVPEPQPAPLLVVKEHPLPPAAQDRVLQSALGEYADDPKVSALIEAVRRHTPAPLTAGNRVDPLVDGPQTFGAIRAQSRQRPRRQGDDIPF